MSLLRFVSSLFVVVILGVDAIAQVDSATLAGRVVESSGKSIAGARVALIDLDRNTQSSRLTSRSGLYVFPSVSPGRYRMEIHAPGFRRVTLATLTLSTADTVQENFILTAGTDSTGASPSVLAQVSGTVSSMVDRDLVEQLPLNGRSFQTLFQLTPGVVITPTSFASPGQFSVNGQRTDTNYFMVDGTSANVGTSVSATPGQSLGGALPALTAQGGTNSLVPVDDVQEFAILTSSFAPEFGRTPGGQVSIVTRSGTNQIHAEVFDYLRNDAVDANDWFANRNSLKRAALRQNDFGAVAGGPILQKKSFYFVSYEGLRLDQPTTGESDVPTLASRESAVVPIQPFLNAYPLPTGPDEGNGLAPATYSFSNPSRMDAANLRIDQHIRDNLQVFGRYNISGSDQRVRGANIATLSSVSDLHTSLQTLTLGATWSPRSHLSNTLRFNWSTSSARSGDTLDGLGGAIPISVQSLLPAPFTASDSQFVFLPTLSGANSELSFGKNVANFESQINFIENVAWEMSGHSLKAGVDVRWSRSRTEGPLYSQDGVFTDMSETMTGIALLGIVRSSTPVDSRFVNWSLFVEDTWRAGSRLSCTYGVRWDLNPSPTARGANGLLPLVVVGLNNLSTLSLAPAGSPLYQTTATNFAPRVGITYQLHSSSKTQTMIRTGAGVFYDFANGALGNAVSAVFSPFSSIRVLSGALFPMLGSNGAAVPFSSQPPFTQIVAFPTVLRLPYTYQWNIFLDESIGGDQTVSLGYVGSGGHRLLKTTQYQGGEGGVPLSFERLFVTDNGGYSNYNALQIELRRRASQGLDIIASYTLSHSLDNVSTDVQFTFPRGAVSREGYAPSDFDIRHIATVGFDYTLPAPNRSSIARQVIANWVVDASLIYRSAPPIDVFLLRDIDLGLSSRPDRVPGRPLYIEDPSAPGKVRINTAAFSVPTSDGEGNFGRNGVRGFSLYQIDLALRRNLRLHNRFVGELRIEAFNLLNHPNFASESGQLGTVDVLGNFSPASTFGVSSSSSGNGFQTGGPGSGFSPLYQTGQSRSLQGSVKVRF